MERTDIKVIGAPSYDVHDQGTARAAASGNRGRQAPRAARPRGMMSFSEAMKPEGRREFADTMRGGPRAGAAVAVPEPVTVAQHQAQPVAPAALRREIDGAELLDNFAKYWRRHAWFDSESKVTAIALWNIAEHFRDESGAVIFPEFAHLGFFSEPGSGKTRCLQILQLLGANGPSIPIEPSEAAVALMLGKEHRLLLLDEGDVLFGSGEPQERYPRDPEQQLQERRHLAAGPQGRRG